MKIFTNFSVDNTRDDPVDTCIAGSYLSREKANVELANYIIERIGINGNIALAVCNDENHKDAKRYFKVKKDGIVLRSVDKMRRYLVDTIAVEGCYRVYDGEDCYDFYTEENDVEGMTGVKGIELWTLVRTSGPDGTASKADIFCSKEDAVKSARERIRKDIKLMFKNNDDVKIRLDCAIGDLVKLNCCNVYCVGTSHDTPPMRYHFRIEPHPVFGSSRGIKVRGVL